MPPNVKMLTNLGTHEISLVKSAANRKRYAITKSEEDKMKIAKAVIETPAEGEEQLIATLKSAGADEKRIDAAVAAYRIQKGFADVVTAEDMEAVAKAMEPVAKAKKAKEEDPAEPDEDDDMPAFLKKKKAKKSAELEVPSLEALPPEQRAQVEAVFKSNATLMNQVTALTNTVQGLISTNTEKEYVAKAAAQYKHVPGSHAELGQLLKSAHENGIGAGIEKLLGTVNELVQKSGLMTTLGSPGGGAGATGGSAWTRIEQLAGGLTLKSEKGVEMTVAQKVWHVCTKTAEGKALYHQYLLENEAQRSKFFV